MAYTFKLKIISLTIQMGLSTADSKQLFLSRDSFLDSLSRFTPISMVLAARPKKVGSGLACASAPSGGGG
jgi:hypothetical protein